jgi:ParB family chromosome partitioning protein
MTAETDLYQRPRDPRSEQRLQELASKLIADGAMAPDSAPPAVSTPRAAAAGGAVVEIRRVHPNPRNIRSEIGDVTEMAASMALHGVLQPLVVRDLPGIPGDFEIIAGHRRHAAAQLAGLDEVPVTVRAAAASVADAELMLIENLHRSGLNPMDKAEAMGELRDSGYSAGRIAESIGVSDSAVYYYLSLLDLDDKSRQRVRDGRLSAADAVDGIRRARRKQRRQEGKAQLTGGMWEPDHFTDKHPLARKAAALCDARQHTMRRRVGRIACGQCWETVIRQDERVAESTLASQE